MDTFAFLVILTAASLKTLVPGPCMMLALGRSAVRGIGARAQVKLGMAPATLVRIAVAWVVTQRRNQLLQQVRSDLRFFEVARSGMGTS